MLVPKFKTVRGIKSIKPYRPNDGSDPFDGLPINRHLSLDDYALVERGLIDTEAAGAVASLAHQVFGAIGFSAPNPFTLKVTFESPPSFTR